MSSHGFVVTGSSVPGTAKAMYASGKPRSMRRSKTHNGSLHSSRRQRPQSASASTRRRRDLTVHRDGAVRPQRNLPTPAYRNAKHVQNVVSEKLMTRFSNLRSAFRTLDVDKNGTISPSEFKQGLARLGIKLNNKELVELVQHYDRNHDGRVDYQEFLSRTSNLVSMGGSGGFQIGNSAAAGGVAQRIERAVAEHMMASANKALAAFRRYDRHGTGEIEPAAFRRALEDCGIRVSDEDAEKLLPLYDLNQDGSISYSEFSHALASFMRTQGRARLPSASKRATMRPGRSVPHLKPLAGRAVGNRLAARDVEKTMASTLYTKFGRVQDAFLMFDEDRDGRISREEFKLALNTLGFDMQADELNKLISKYDVDHDGSISYAEFNKNVGKIMHGDANRDNSADRFRTTSQAYHDGRQHDPSSTAAWAEQQIASTALGGLKHAEECFGAMDANGDGVLSRSEFAAGLDRFGMKLGRDELNSLMHKFDPHGAGHIDLKTWKKRFAELLPKIAEGELQGISDRSAFVGVEERTDAALVQRVLGGFQRAQKTFSLLDPQGTGKLRHADFRKALQLYGCPFSRPDFEDFLAEYDPHNTGFISYRDFNSKVGALMHTQAGATVVSDDMGQLGPHTRKTATLRAPVASVERAFAQLAVGNLQRVQQHLDRLNKNSKGYSMPYKKFLQGLKDCGFRLKADMSRNLLHRLDPGHTGQVDVRNFNSIFVSMIKNPHIITGGTGLPPRASTPGGAGAGAGAGAGTGYGYGYGSGGMSTGRRSLRSSGSARPSTRPSSRRSNSGSSRSGWMSPIGTGSASKRATGWA